MDRSCKGVVLTLPRKRFAAPQPYVSARALPQNTRYMKTV